MKLSNFSYETTLLRIGGKKTHYALNTFCIITIYDAFTLASAWWLLFHNLNFFFPCISSWFPISLKNFYLKHCCELWKVAALRSTNFTFCTYSNIKVLEKRGLARVPSFKLCISACLDALMHSKTMSTLWENFPITSWSSYKFKLQIRFSYSFAAICNL